MPSPAEAKETHKAMAGGERFQFPPDLHPYSPETDFRQDGGLLASQSGVPVSFVRGPFWRAEENDPTVRQDDVHPLFRRREQENLSLLRITDVDVGGELETYWWTPSGRAFLVMAADSPVKQALIDYNNGSPIRFIEEQDMYGVWPEEIAFSAELAQFCLELNFDHSPDSLARGIQQLKVLQTLAKIGLENGAFMIPVSSFPHRPLSQEDVNENPYVRRIALEYMGWENVRLFVGASWQTHSEMITLETALKATNYLQQIAPIIHALTLSGPFIDGNIFLSDRNLTGMGENPDIWHSVRYLTRYLGSPSGGVLREPLPETEREFWQRANDLLRTGEIPTPARTGGHHTDFRLRPDIPPNGTIEVAFMDTAGAHPAKILALQELLRVVSWKLQMAALSAREEELPELLFSSLTPERLRETHHASIAVSQRGIEAEMKAADGCSYPVKYLWEQLIAWVNQAVPEWDFYGLPAGITEELNKSAQVVDIKTLKQYEDRQGLVSSRGFYETGRGTLSQWLLARAFQLTEIGQSEQEAVINCMTELGSAYYAFLQTMEEKDIKALF